MIHICYLFVKEYKALNNTEAVFDSKYNISFDLGKKHLTISKNKKMPDDFWGRGIYSVTGIFGDNGAGKSTMITLLLEILTSGYTGYNYEYIMVYEDSGTLIIHNNLLDKQISVEAIDVRNRFTDSRITIPVFYYSGHFLPISEPSDIRFDSLSGLYNATGLSLLVKDVENYSNIGSTQLHNSLLLHLQNYVKENNYRICRMLANQELRQLIVDFVLPRYVYFGVNNSGSICWQYKVTTKTATELPPFNTLKFGNTKEDYLYKFVKSDIQNAINDAIDIENPVDVVLAWNKVVNDKDEIVEQLGEFAKNQQGMLKISLQSVYESLKLLRDIAQFRDPGVFFLDFIADNEKVVQLVEHCKSVHFLRARAYDLYYSQTLSFNDITALSSGEQELLDLFSRIYDAVYMKNADATSLLFFDEAEIGFHPEWQRKYILLLISFLHAMMVGAGIDFQVVLTSHSPILLSDFPKYACNYLKKIDRHQKNVRDEQNETFASNVFDLYRNTFFLNKGLIGEFAEKKLIQLEQDVRNGNQNVGTQIALIGDDRLRGYFENLLKQSNKEAAIAYYKNQLKELEEIVE